MERSEDLNTKYYPCTNDTMKMDLSDIRPVAKKALEAGAVQTAISSFCWNVAGNCQSPRRVTLAGRAFRKPLPYLRVSEKGTIYGSVRSEYIRNVSYDLSNCPMWVDLDTRCRRCEACNAHRKRLWQARILAELNSASRSWFGTLTISPENHYLAECRSGKDFSVLSEQEKLLALHEANADEITRFWKRVRKKSDGRLRLAMVMEPHKSGLPHYHAVVHECHGSKVLKKTLDEAWTLGWTKWRVVKGNQRAAWYVAKYLSKTLGARVRASKRYGDVSTALAIGPSTEEAVNLKKVPIKGELANTLIERTE